MSKRKDATAENKKPLLSDSITVNEAMRFESIKRDAERGYGVTLTDLRFLVKLVERAL